MREKHRNRNKDIWGVLASLLVPRVWIGLAILIGVISAAFGTAAVSVYSYP